MYLEDYQAFRTAIAEISFSAIQQKFVELSSSNMNQFLPKYVPTLHQFEQEFDQHSKADEKLKKVPSFDGKKEYNNTDNLHRRLLALMRSFLLSEYKDFREYLRLSVEVDQLSAILSRVEVLRFKSAEFNLVYYLFTMGRRSIRLYLKLREEVLKEGGGEPIRNMPISTHNSAKYTEKYPYLDRVALPAQHWGELVNLAGFEYDEEFTRIAFTGNEYPSLTQSDRCGDDRVLSVAQ